MLYKVEATFDNLKIEAFFRRLCDGSIANQKPDGAEIVASMKRAKLTEDGRVIWYETCYCPTPLRHEKATVYDHYFTNVVTEPVTTESPLNGPSFWDYLSEKTSTSQ